MLKWASPISRQYSDKRSPLSLVSYLSKFACNNSANKHHTSHLGDCDVAPLTESDFQPDEPGNLSSPQNVQLFIDPRRLCLVVSEWLDLRQPPPAITSNIMTVSKPALQSLRTGTKELSSIIQAPKDGTRFTIWNGVLHIAYHALHFRLATSLPPRPIPCCHALGNRKHFINLQRLGRAGYARFVVEFGYP